MQRVLNQGSGGAGKSTLAGRLVEILDGNDLAAKRASQRRDIQMITASCHCGAVRIDIYEMPETVTQCTCSICRRYGALWAYRTRRTARVLNGPEVEGPYLWNDKVIEFYHCRNCGCLTRYESVDKAEDSRIAVNARMLAPEDIAGIRIRTFDGADTWKYLDERKQ